MQELTTYDAAVAKALLELAFPEWESVPYIVRHDGVYQSETYRAVCPPGELFDWTPVYDMNWPGAPNPMTAPMLPIPFTAAELAAFMLDGAGAMIPEALECSIGGRVEDSPRLPTSPRLRDVRSAVRSAYFLTAQAMERVGFFDHDKKIQVHALLERYEEANGQANASEGVFAGGISQNEAGARRARAAASVAGVKTQAEDAKRELDSKWRGWRTAMVSALLGPDAGPAKTQAADSSNMHSVGQGTRAALTVEQKAELAKLYKYGKGTSVSSLAKQFSVSRRTVDQALFDAGLKKVTPRKERSVSKETARKPA